LAKRDALSRDELARLRHVREVVVAHVIQHDQDDVRPGLPAAAGINGGVRRSIPAVNGEGDSVAAAAGDTSNATTSTNARRRRIK
jgi:hypothetical protein